MRPAINSVDIVCEAKDRLGVRIVVLEGDFDRDLAAVWQFAITLKVSMLIK